MKITNKACAGTREKSDIAICIAPGNAGIQLSVTSVVEQQFGGAIRQTILAGLAGKGIKDAVVEAEDFGAPDFVIQARLEAALQRGAGEEDI